MDNPTTPTPPTPRKPRDLRRSVSRWSLVVLVGLGSALVIDLTRQAMATDRVRWTEVQTIEQWTQAAPASASSPTYVAQVDSANAPETPRPRLIRFTADWCPPCLSMKADVFSKTAVAEAIHQKFEAYSVDLTRPNAEQQALGLHYQITYLPTLLITDAQGREIARLDEAADADAFLAWLNAGHERWEQTRDRVTPSSEAAESVKPAATLLSPVAHKLPIN